MLLSDVRTDLDAAIAHTLTMLRVARAAAATASAAETAHARHTSPQTQNATTTCARYAARVAGIAADYHTGHVRTLEEMLTELMTARAEIGRII